MKKPVSILSQIRAALIAALIAFACHPALSLTFTNNANIGPANTNFDGLDITVSNCTLVVDGAHAFNSLRVAGGGVLTHTFSPSGAISNLYYMTNEAQVLYGTTPVTLLNSYIILGTVTVTAYGTTNVYTNSADYLLYSPDGIVTQLQRTSNSTIPDGGIVLVSYQGFGASQGTVPAGINLTVSNNVQIDAGGAINANGLGYSAGPGVGGSSSSGGGGGYGGNGGPGANGVAGGISYGAVNSQASLGSGGGSSSGTGGGGPGGAGGGLVQITALGNVIVNGSINANGANGINDRSGGGSGGSIFITANALSGLGLITANGGMGEPTQGGGGGGGRISLQYNATSFAGTMTAFGGLGNSFGAAGTIYTKQPGQNGLIVFDNGGHQSQTNSSISVSSSTTDLLIRSNASVTPASAMFLGNLTIASNSFMVANNNLTTLVLTLGGALTVQAGGGIVANGAGFAQNAGTAAGHFINDGLFRPCGGGGYGGYGASSPSNSLATGGATYGNQSSPIGYGSGGGGVSPNSTGGSGGGDIQITAQGGIVQVDGVISANGLNGSGTGGGGGAGGTVWLSGGTLVGAGSITANGGSGVSGVGGGGGGGRIQISPAANLFSGSITAYGGDGGARAGAGTVLVQVSGQNAQLILDNGGHLGTNTVVQGASSTDLIIRGGAVACTQQSGSFANLFLNSNGWIFPYFASTTGLGSSVFFTFTGNATIQAGGGIIADLAGNPGGSGTGAGHTTGFGSTNLCSGAGHGGPGGNSFGNFALGGGTYDSITEPNSPGSGGGNSFPLSPGGSGGGLIHITVTGALEVDGIISANGANGSGLAGGGGAGGSIQLSAATIVGVGSISANGGSGANGLGGGGGGGIISLPLANNFFSGPITAYGGGGANRGGAGPILMQGFNKNSQLILDGGGNPGPATPLSTAISSSSDVTVRNGATGFIASSQTIGNLLIGSNSTLITSNLSSLSCSTLTVQVGGSIIADAQNNSGNAVGQNSSASNYPCGGGGNGGPGGSSIGNLAAGGVNLLYYQAFAGSPGGSIFPNSFGGLGGGRITITCTGLSQIDGILSVNGGNGSGSGGGGGAGGSISLTCGSFGGIGAIRANGGAGVDSIGGGGGGGTIFITVNSSANQFNGTITAYGGSGANRGGTGPITITMTGQPVQYVLDAGGNAATPSPIYPPTLASLTLRNGAIGLAGSSQTTLSLGNLLIASNSFLYLANLNTLVAVISFTNGTIQAGGGIIADAQGYGPGMGNGSGRSSSISPYYPCGGGGHGGFGGNSISNIAVGGAPYDNQLSPNSPGSGGGTLAPNSLGGSGGGAFVMNVTGILQVDGVISANGGNGSAIGGGGGAGGAIRISGGSLAGLGSIRANGGNGVANIGGGGGGGIIAILSATNLFTGNISALGGNGANRGGAGTLYFQNSLTGQNGQLVLDNGGQLGGLTAIQSVSSSTALILRNGAVAYPGTSPQTFASILIASNAWIIANTNTGTLNLTITGSATLQPGGGIIADGQGSPQGSGPGAGQLGSGINGSSGAGYGGNGGNGNTNHAIGGAAYGSITSPLSLGSGGGGDVPFSIGGGGGGAINLNVTGTLDVSGTISAGGNNGGGLGGGGGSGGSVFLNVSFLTGNGAILANGGAGAGTNGGGGGGGRISLAYKVNSSSFVGITAARGGNGFVNGGAGTIYTKTSSQSVGQLLVDNGGLIGTNTPLAAALGAPTIPFDVIAQNGAVVGPQPNMLFPELNNLTLKSGGALTGLPGATLDVIVVNSVDVAPGGAIILDGEGYAQHVGPGAGQSFNGTGGGAGYGGVGGASVSAAGGLSYGSATQPVDFGSGGGTGTGTTVGGSAGGGALRLNVGGVLTIDGDLTSEGQLGFQDDSGGGSGGSIWITAGMLAGSGDVAADGGEGQLYYGGGGAGGRIALYCRTNAYFGATSAAGAAGFAAGANGTIVLSNNVAPLVVLASVPTGTVSNSLSTALISFSGAPNPATVSGATVTINTPNGLLSPSSVVLTMVNSSTYQASFPWQTTPGDYALVVSQGITDLYSRPLSQIFTQAFSISLPVIQGTVTDGIGNPLAGVTLQNDAGYAPATTDTNGNYTVGFVPGTTLTITPALPNYVFTPLSLSYTNATASITGQNYTGMSTLAPALTTSVSSNSLVINWQGVVGVNYYIYASSNLIDWVQCGNYYSGSNGPAQCSMPIVTTNGMQFFTVQPGN